MVFKPLREHIADLSKVFVRMNDWNGYEDVSEWLRIASAIQSIDFDDTKYDDLLGYCRYADNFVSAHDVMLQKYVTDLSIFAFVWSALECFIDHIIPEDTPIRKKYGKLGAACHLIALSLDISFTPVGYDEELPKLKLADPRVDLAKVSARFLDLPPHVNHQGTGLYVVYKLRNLYAHGALPFPILDTGWDEPIPNITVLEYPIRIVLLSMQMLLIANEPEKKNTIGYYWNACEYLADDDDISDLRELLKVIHLQDFDEYWFRTQSETQTEIQD